MSVKKKGKLLVLTSTTANEGGKTKARKSGKAVKLCVSWCIVSSWWKNKEIKVKGIYKVQLRKFISWGENEKKFMEIFHETEKLGELEGVKREFLWDSKGLMIVCKEWENWSASGRKELWEKFCLFQINSFLMTFNEFL